MSPLKARVERGRIRLDEPTSLPDGTVLNLVVDDEGDDLDEREREALAAAIERAARSAREGRLRSASDLIDDLRRQP
jgi:hypothetical protein